MKNVSARLLASCARCLTVCLVFVFSTAASADADWQLEHADSQNNITVYSRILPSGHTEFRGVTVVRSRLSTLIAVLLDVRKLPDWAYRTRLARPLKAINSQELIIYSVANLPWPFLDRDMVIRSRLVQDQRTLIVRVRGTAIPDFIQPEPNLVRVPLLESSWCFIPGNDGQVQVVFRGHGDPGGSLSSGLLRWLLKSLIANAPRQTLVGLQSVMRREEYRTARFDFVREPDPLKHRADPAMKLPRIGC